MLTFQATIVEIPKLSLVGNSVKWYHFIMYAAIIVPVLPRPAGIKKMIVKLIDIITIDGC